MRPIEIWYNLVDFMVGTFWRVAWLLIAGGLAWLGEWVRHSDTPLGGIAGDLIGLVGGLIGLCLLDDVIGLISQLWHRRTYEL